MGISTITIGVLNLLILLILATSGIELPIINPKDWSRNRRDLPDLHGSDEFCVDVSKYGNVTFKVVKREKCETTFVKNCQPKTERVCDDVTEIQCDIVPYTECEMGMQSTPYKSCVPVQKNFTEKDCKEMKEVTQHKKMIPECRNVTKQNCVTKWETDANGKQVWAGNEDCEPVTWRDCRLVHRYVDFIVPKVSCFPTKEIPYTDWVEEIKIEMTTSMVCKVKHSIDCRPTISNKCKDIKYQECKEEPIEDCKDHDVMIPIQELVHKKKCLLPDSGASGDYVDSISHGGFEPYLRQSESRLDSVSTIPDSRQKRPRRPTQQQQQDSSKGKTTEGQVGGSRQGGK